MVAVFPVSIPFGPGEMGLPYGSAGVRNKDRDTSTLLRRRRTPLKILAHQEAANGASIERHRLPPPPPSGRR